MSDTCSKHSFETAAGVCRQCENSYCAECLIFAFGPDKPPYCTTCALNAAGVRHQGAKRNPRIQRTGFFRRKVLVDPDTPEPLGFDDVQIELPEREESRRFRPREIDPEVLARVEAAEQAVTPQATATAPDTAVAGVASRLPDMESLAAWAASLDDPRHGGGGDTMSPRPEDRPIEPWPGSPGTG